MRRGLMRTLVLAVTVCGLGIAACDSDQGPSSTAQGSAEPDARLRMHAVEPGTPTREGLAYVRAVADAMARAEAVEGEARIEFLR
ncbi:MAG: hypothetical protein JKY37_23100, partial [Nannocystaceae bacterium]|nr:hypothetical protein [Nannocystaceae bacterium]